MNSRCLPNGTRAAACARMEPKRPAVVIIGAGFGGLAAAKALKRAPVEVTVVDRENYHLFQPLLYQVATAELPESVIATPVRSILARQRNTRVLLGEVMSIDFDRRSVRIQLGGIASEIAYDYLVVATGAEANYFGHDAWETIAPSPKSLDAAIDIRRRLLLAVEAAEGIDDPATRQKLLDFVIVGGGPTGVEFAGALGEARSSGRVRNYRRINPRQARVHLVEAGPRILASYPEELSRKAVEQLEQLGVRVHTGTAVADIDPDGATLANGVHLEAATVIWTAGVKPNSLAEAFPGERRHGRVVVEPDLSLPGHPDVFVIGDMAHVERDGRALPAVSPVAIQQGHAAARAIMHSMWEEPREPFRYLDKGMLATIGPFRAVAEIGRLRMSGPLAWMTWATVHLFYLVGFGNRLAVLLRWIATAITFARGTPIITGASPPVVGPHLPRHLPAAPAEE